MLQWMGGSRRKVTTSRRSTQNRQKQYFEQRKRRQQQTSGLENCHDTVETGREHHKEHRSLDILSLLNLSTIPEENKTSYTSETSAVRSHFTKNPASTLHNIETLEESDEFVDKRAPSGYKGETLSPVNNMHGDPHHHNNTKYEVECNSDQGRTSVEPNLSIFDLLGDDGTIGNSIGSPKEAHVAFSVEGLGRVGMETPPCSPQYAGRSFPNGFSPRIKTTQCWNSSKKMNTLDDLELEVDTMTLDIDKPCDDGFLNYSINMMDAWGNPEKSPEKTSYRFVEDSKRSKYYGGKSIFDGMDGERDTRRDGFSFSDNDFLGEIECDFFEKKHSNQIDCDSTDFLKYGTYPMSENAFDSPYQSKKRGAPRTMGEFNFESAKSSLKLHSSRYDYDLMSNAERNSRTTRNSGFGDKSLQPDWFCSGADNTIDSFSLLSEESCSSSAVRGEAFNSTPLNSNPRQSMRRGRDGDSGSDMSYSVNSIYSREPCCKIGDEVNQGDCAHGPGKYARKSNSSKSKPVRYSSPPFMEKLVPFESWSPEKERNLSSFCQNPAADHPFIGSMPWTGDPCIGSVPESSYTNKHDETAAHPPSSFISKRFSIQPSNVESGVVEGDLCPTSELIGMYPDMAEATSSHGGDSISPALSTRESVGKEGKSESKFSPFGMEKVDFEEEKCTRSKDIFTDNRELLDENKNYESIGSEVQNVSLAVENLETSHYSVPAEKTQPLSVKIPDKTGSADENKYKYDDKVSVACLKGEKEVKDVRLQGSKVGSKNCGIDSSSHSQEAHGSASDKEILEREKQGRREKYPTDTVA